MANLPDFWGGSPFRPISRLQRQIDRLFALSPAVDIEEKEDRYELSFDLPGVSKADIKIEIRGNQLYVSGERKEKRTESETKGTYRSERFNGVFERFFPLPMDAKVDQIEATYDNGVLIVSVPKTEGGKPRQIRVTERTEEKKRKEAA